MSIYLPILFEDNDLIAINKPHNLLVHKSPIAADTSEYAVQILRDQIGKKVFPVHRLDRKTGGVLVFALNRDVLIALNNQFIEKKVQKTYHAIVRGYTDNAGSIDYPLINDKGKEQDAVTHYRTLCRSELPFETSNFPTSRYSFVEVRPETGRMHQIRKHFAHIFHPIIGDRPHGCNKQNRFFKQQFTMDTMLLHAFSIGFTHPVSGESIELHAEYSDEFIRMIELLQFDVVNF